ncbi:TolC family protein [Pontibacter sp. BT310]|uniref:TolC family protein n=1 Tax=Pontibacter populi TaxID=890055 RepID=A0ABS6X6Q5_9BACT|nr:MULTISPECIES: TolC family protein [Pontibacter]MBJ6116835.1 TolC family protein [Pontibacter sp. BT310]MBR0569257.1 TolC family protein [Microvirga sp. STS03]MBW3363688.1 TolC family protein [Pontibacter populi]
MKYKIAVLFAFALILLSGRAKAQEVLTLEEAIRITLERNYDIKLVANDLEISRNNVSTGNAGMLPVVEGNLVQNNTIQNSSQTRESGQEVERNGAKGSTLNYGVGLNWTVFDGFGMFARYDQLKELRKLGEANLQQTILTRVADVTSVYYDLVQQQQQLKALDTAMVISRERVQTAQNRFEIGKAARLEVLNAQVDFNTDTTNILRQRELYQNTQTQLNELMARDANTRFRVEETITIDDQLNFSELSAKAIQQNPSLQAALISKRVAELDLKQVRANRLPTISLNSGYNLSRSESALGFTTLSTGKGFNYGVSASVPIFNGFQQRRNQQNASINISSAELEYERLNQTITTQLTTAYNTYQTSLSLVNLEEKNQEIAKRNLEITMEKFRIGSITPIEFREAQLNYVNATVRYSNAQYLAKLAEVSLKEIAGTLTF